MATFNTVWSLDIGRSALKAVKLRREKNNIEILEVDKIDYSVGPDGIDSASQAAEALSAFKARNQVRDPVIVCHNGQGTLSRFIKIPAFDPKKVKEMVGYEAAQQIPFPLDEVIWDYHIIDKDYVPGEEREIGLFAARRDAIEDYLVDFENAGLDVEGVTIGYLGLLNFILYDIAPEEPTIFLDIGASHADLILVDGKRFWTRALPHSGNEITKAIMDRFKLNFSEAEKIKIHCARNKQQAVKIFTAVIQPRLKDLVNEIHRSIGYYRSQSGEVQFKQAYLLGNGSKVLGIKKFLQEHLELPVHQLQGISRLRVNRDANLKLLQNNLPAFATAFGSALQGVGVGSCRVDLLPQEEKVQKEFGRKKKHVFVALAILAILTVASGMMINQKQRDPSDPDVRRYTAYARDVRDTQRDLNEILEKERDNSAEMELLADVARLRKLPLQSLSILGEVLESLDPDEFEALRALNDESRPAQLAQLKARAQAIVDQNAWVPWLKVSHIDWPEVEGRGSSRDRDRATVPAYKFEILGVVREQETQEASLKQLQKLLADPLRRKLQKAELSRDLEFEIKAETQQILQKLYYSEEVRRSRGGRRRSSDDSTVEVQEGGPFFGAKIVWILRADDLPASGEGETPPQS